VSTPTQYDAVLMIGFGAPTGREEIGPFLEGLLRGRPVPKERVEEVARHYKHIGGRSPYNELTMRQADALAAELRREGEPIPVFVGMRNWRPYVLDTMRAIGAAGARRALGFILAAHRCEASWGRYQETVRTAREEIGASACAIDYPPTWHNHPLLVRAVAARASEAIARLSAEERQRAHLIFTAHSIPVAMAAASPYVDQFTESSRLVADALGYKSFTLAFQSRSGNLGDPWLEPDIGAAIRKLAGKPAVVVPIGFLCDHLEVLYDLDVDAARIAREAGVHMERAATVGDHPLFIQMMASVIRQQAS
jgi:protoporphyrin/coproporphyrin ferrochelatase